MRKILLSVFAFAGVSATSFGQTDTISEFFTGTPALYVVDAVAPADSGFVFGNNYYGDVAKIMKFDAVTGYTGTGFIKSALIGIPRKVDGGGSLKVKVWAYSSNTVLGAELASVTVPLSQVDTSAAAFAFAGGSPRIYNLAVNFPTQIAVPASGAFMIGVELPSNTTGAIGLFSNMFGSFAAAATNTFEIWNDNTLHTVPVFWGAGVTCALAIFPVVKYSAAGVDELNLTSSIYPNPATNEVNFTLNGVQMSNIKVYGLDGKLILDNEVNATAGQIDVSSLNNGMYICEITSANGGVVKSTFVKK
jgi:hypothetical protein